MNIRLTLLLVFFSFKAFTQNFFQDIPFADALQQSKQTGKLVFIQFESPNCTGCNQLADKTFESKDLSARMKQTFITLKITRNHSDRKQIAKDYNIVNGFGTFIVDHNGTLIKRMNYSSSSAIFYDRWIDAALIEAGENLKINEMDRMHKDGNNDPAFMELYIKKKKELDLPYDALLEEYARSLPADSLQSTRILQFILRMEPSVLSLAYHTATQNKPLFLKTWYELKPPLRNTIKSNMIMKSMAKAAPYKDVALAKRIVSFVMDTEDKDLPHQETLRYCDQLIMNYYKNSGNFDKYVKNAITYYDTYYLNRNLDELKKADSLFLSLRFARNPLTQNSATQPKATTTTGKTTIRRDTIRTQSIALNSFGGLNFGYVDDLNHGAIIFYRLPKTSQLLHKAIAWAQLSLSIRETATAYYAYARLLYKLDQKEKAIEMQTKAVALLSTKGATSEHYEKLLEKMKQGVDDLDRSMYVNKQ